MGLRERIRFKVLWVRLPVQIAFLLFSWTIGSEAVRVALGDRLEVGLLPESVRTVLRLLYEALSLPLLSFGAVQVMLSKPYFPWLAAGILILMPLILGGAFCGWVCPFGLVMDLLSYVRRKRVQISPRTHSQARRIKYVVLGLTLVVSGSLAAALASGGGDDYRTALGASAAAPYYSVSPATTIFVLIPELLAKFQESPGVAASTWEEQWEFLSTTPILLYARLVIAAITVLGGVYISRFWCRYFCPLGAMISVFSRVGFLGLRRDPVKCGKCRECVERCPMAVRILDLPWEKLTDPDCTMCLVCRDACPQRAIRPKLS